MPSDAEAHALFDRRRRAWLQEDLDGYLACWTEDMLFGAPSHPEPLRGREAFAALVRGSLAATRPLRFDVHHLAVAGDVVLAEWTIAVEHRASGREIAWRGMSVAELAGSRIRCWREYWNPADVAAARERGVD